VKEALKKLRSEVAFMVALMAMQKKEEKVSMVWPPL
jgi:hypothetical protein